MIGVRLQLAKGLFFAVTAVNVLELQVLRWFDCRLQTWGIYQTIICRRL
jgi:hypothetical protein